MRLIGGTSGEVGGEVGGVPRYRGSVRVSFPAALSLRGLEPGDPAGRPHGHDFTAVLVFESTTLVYPGVVVDDDMRTEIPPHLAPRHAYRALARLFDRPPTCEAIAEHLATWHRRSARPPGHARLVAVTVRTGSGDHGEIHLPAPAGTST
ncbi:MAG: 6-carboxytetrahydropterin synthase [Pseudonocardia sp.]|nr:6-carboxytetrahydropterin synthase [Pseudonocardia sp.]